MKLWVYSLGAGTIEVATQFRTKPLMCARDKRPTSSDKTGLRQWDSKEPAAINKDLQI
jgi:hypothetical protein